MTIAEWLARREPRPPAELQEGIAKVLGPEAAKDSVEGTAVFLAGAERLLRQLVAEGETGRPIANQLLVIDALTTYAVEIATETMQSLEATTDDAVGRFANLMKPGDYSA